MLDIANSTETPAQQQASVQQAVNNEVGFIDGLVAHGANAAPYVVMGARSLTGGSRPPLHEMAARRLNDAHF